MQLTNDVLENNSGVVAGGIGVGQPYDHASHNRNVRIANDRLVGNGTLTDAGNIGIFYNSDGYEIANSVICAGFSVTYGAGVSHIGFSPGGRIHDNQIYYNASFDAGAGVAIESELPVGGGLGAGTGSVDLDRNLIQSNYSGDDGGGIFVLDSLTAAINIRNNQIVDNGAADLGGAVLLDDASNVRIVNNTIANNVSTGSAEDSDGNPHAAGLVSEANDPAFQAMLPAGSPDFSRPAALFNNIFWDNEAFLLDRPGPGATLVTQGFLDFEIHGTTNNADTFTPRYSDLTNGQILGPDGVQHAVPGGQGNLIGVDPGFVNPFTLILTVTGSRLDPQTAAVSITGADPPVGLTGDYHLTGASALVDRGVRCSNTPFPAPASALGPCAGGGIQAPVGVPSAANPGGGDYDSQYRPMLRTFRIRTPWDLGADELPGLPVPLP
jgi:large repetitive protein